MVLASAVYVAAGLAVVTSLAAVPWVTANVLEVLVMFFVASVTVTDALLVARTAVTPA